MAKLLLKYWKNQNHYIHLFWNLRWTIAKRLSGWESVDDIIDSDEEINGEADMEKSA